MSICASNNKRRLIAFLLAVLTLIAVPLTTIQVNAATSVSDEQAYVSLKRLIVKGKIYTARNKSKSLANNKKYKVKDGGYYLYGELSGYTAGSGSAYANGSTADASTKLIVEDRFSKLTAGAKQDFLKDVFKVANAAAYYEMEGITDGTVTEIYDELQTYNGMGSQLMASLLSETKPDYATANRIYKPFSGIVGTCLGFLSIIILALLGLTMALDLAFICIPTVQLILGSERDGGGSGNGATKAMSKIVSIEAVKAVQSSADGGKDGDYKAAVGIYFKYRWKGLVILGICLLYLVQGQIWTFVAWIIDLLSGFLGF